MGQTNLIKFPLQAPETDRLRLYRDEPGTVVVLSAVRAGLNLRYARKSVSCLRRRDATKPFPWLQETFFPASDVGWKQTAFNLSAIDQRWSCIMLAIITLLYREYCKARVAEMRARHLGAAV